MDKVLNVPFQHQQTSTWCWAAVASMVSSWYAARSGGQALSQCDVASATLGVGSCCSAAGINPDCIKFSELDKALSAVGHFADLGDSGGFETVVEQINAEQPLGALMKYWSGIFHVVLVSGYSESQQLIVVCDPAGGQPFSTPKDSFFSSYNNGASWGGWYFTA